MRLHGKDYEENSVLPRNVLLTLLMLTNISFETKELKALNLENLLGFNPISHKAFSHLLVKGGPIMASIRNHVFRMQ